MLFSHNLLQNIMIEDKNNCCTHNSLYLWLLVQQMQHTGSSIPLIFFMSLAQARISVKHSLVAPTFTGFNSGTGRPLTPGGVTLNLCLNLLTGIHSCGRLPRGWGLGACSLEKGGLSKRRRQMAKPRSSRFTLFCLSSFVWLKQRVRSLQGACFFFCMHRNTWPLVNIAPIFLRSVHPSVPTKTLLNDQAYVPLIISQNGL